MHAGACSRAWSSATRCSAPTWPRALPLPRAAQVRAHHHRLHQHCLHSHRLRSTCTTTTCKYTCGCIHSNAAHTRAHRPQHVPAPWRAAAHTAAAVMTHPTKPCAAGPCAAARPWVRRGWRGGCGGRTRCRRVRVCVCVLVRMLQPQHRMYVRMHVFAWRVCACVCSGVYARGAAAAAAAGHAPCACVRLRVGGQCVRVARVCVRGQWCGREGRLRRPATLQARACACACMWAGHHIGFVQQLNDLPHAKLM